MTYRIEKKFTNPFRYSPSEAVRAAAQEVIARIRSDRSLEAAFGEGKMLGVLIVRDLEGNEQVLAGFSGNIGGKSTIPGFVPPILDIQAPEGHFKKMEAEISFLNGEIARLENSGEIRALAAAVENAENAAREELDAFKKKMDEAKAARDAIREMHLDGNDDTSAALIKESQFMKAEFRRLKQTWRERISEKNAALLEARKSINEKKILRQKMSENLQEWLFEEYKVSNARGERKSIMQIFKEKGLVPPGGTGECAAPKLLQYAYNNGLEPLEMGEFWYGASPEKEVRISGDFYPSCTSKCGPLLGFMIEGLDVTDEEEERIGNEEIVYSDDDIIVCEKPSGMPSVPGKNGLKSLQERLEERFGEAVYPVHRLDMDTAGLIVFAKNAASQRALQEQFAGRQVSKSYCARLRCGSGCADTKFADKKGIISLPLSPDYNDRPRQIVDPENGKEAITEYEVTGQGDAWTEVILRPITGRTHQLRVHAAHPDGLGSPIIGDRLYGSAGDAARLCLKAFGLTFRHPSDGRMLSFSISREFNP